MEKGKSNRTLMVVAAIGLALIAGLGLYSWQLHQKVQQLENEANRFMGGLPEMLPDFPARDWDPWTDPWDPSGHFAEMQKRMDELMNRMAPGGSIFSNRGFGLSVSSPEVTMKETADHYEVIVSVPQGQEVELNTELQENQLTISGKMRSIKEDKNNSTKAVVTSRFSQTVTLAEPTDEAGMTIERQDEKVVVKIPKTG